MRQYPHPAPRPGCRRTRATAALLATAALTVAGALAGTSPAGATAPGSPGTLVNGGF
ncbi:MAG: hypothetical protein HHJ14_14240 [Cellulomonas sp.]|nr:hypothetical protein [Cellulomonas sp.]